MRLPARIGPYPQDQKLYRARSPVFHAERLSKPVIFFQGDKDPVVPPDQAEKMVQALRRRKITASYLLFAGEGHGFKKAPNIQRALDAELYFYAAQVFRTRCCSDDSRDRGEREAADAQKSSSCWRRSIGEKELRRRGPASNLRRCSRCLRQLPQQ